MRYAIVYTPILWSEVNKSQYSGSVARLSLHLKIRFLALQQGQDGFMQTGVQPRKR